MNNISESLNWELFDHSDAVAYAACEKILRCAVQAIDRNGGFSIVLAGGGTPKQTYRLLAQTNSDWAHWHIYYGDERCLPENDPERNSVMAAEAWLDRVQIPCHQIHPIPAHLGARIAAAHYTELITKALPFDMVLLGMGEDGHTASLFPGDRHSPDELVHPVFNAPKPPPDRVSLSVGALSNTDELLFLITGSSKQEAVAAWRNGENLPIAQIQAMQKTTVLIDKTAGLILN
jgi:6-phosphogluconolactonase